MSNITKSDLLKQNKALKNQVSQLQRSKSVKKVNVVSNKKKNNSTPASSVPTWSGQSKALRIHQVERIANVTSNSTTAGNFKADSYQINPANTTTFPWLSGIATLFDKYKFHSLKFFFVNNSPTSIAGNVTMAVDFDTLDSSPTSGVMMSNLAKFVSFAPWKTEELSIPVNRPSNNDWLYTAETIPDGADAKTYNLGNFLISSEGITTTNYLVGYLCVEYDVELLDKNPRAEAVTPAPTPEPTLGTKFVLLTYGNSQVSEGLSATFNNSTKTLSITGVTVGYPIQITCYLNTESSNSSPQYNSKTGLTILKEAYNTYTSEGIFFYTATYTALDSSVSLTFSGGGTTFSGYGFSASQPSILDS